MSVTTKKMLAAIKLGIIETRVREFLVPRLDDPRNGTFVGIDSGRTAEFGSLPYTGKDLVAESLFARYVHSGARIANVERVLHAFDEYLRQIKTFKVGNVLGIRYAQDGFELFLVHNRPPKDTM